MDIKEKALRQYIFDYVGHDTLEIVRKDDTNFVANMSATDIYDNTQNFSENYLVLTQTQSDKMIADFVEKKKNEDPELYSDLTPQTVEFEYDIKDINSDYISGNAIDIDDVKIYIITTY